MSSDDLTPPQRDNVRRFFAMTGQGVHRHILVTIYRRRWLDMFRKSYEIRCYTCPVVVREERTKGCC